MSPRFLIAVLSFVPVCCNAATATWEAFDYKHCIHWSITSDSSDSGEDFLKASKIIQGLKKSGAAEGWYILEGDKQYEYDGTPEYGVCSSSLKNVGSIDTETITCKSDTVFPLAGATFLGEFNQTYRCTNGCENLTFNMLYARGYEDGPDSRDLGAAARKFETVCHEASKEKKFWERYYRNISK